MPKVNIDYKNRKGRLVWDVDDWVSGMNKEGTINASTGRSLIAGVGGVNPFHTVGTLRPSAGPASLTNHTTVGAVINGAVVDGGFVYGIGVDAKVHQSSRTGTVVTASWPHSITAHSGHGTPVGEDIVFYNQGGTDYAFYSWSDNTDGDVGRFNLDATFDDDYMSTVPGGGAVLGTKNYHPMIVGTTGRLYIGDGRNLHQLDNATYTPNRISLPPGFVITSFALYEEYLLIYAHRDLPGSNTDKYSATAFIWDYVSPLFNQAIPLDDNYVRCGFTWRGIPGCFTTGNKNLYALGSNITKLKLFDGRRFQIVETVKDMTLPVKNGVLTTEEYLLFMTSDGTSSKIYCYGSPNPDIKPTLIQTTTLTGAVPGSLLLIDLGAATRLWSSTNGNILGNRWQAHTGVTQTASAYILSAFPALNKRDKMLLTNVTVKFASSSDETGASLKLDLLIDTNESRIVFDSLKTISLNQKKEYTALKNGNVLGTAEQSVGLYLQWDNYSANNIYPIIREIIVDFNIIN